MDNSSPDTKLLPAKEPSSDELANLDPTKEIGRNRFATVNNLFQRLLQPFKLTPQEKRLALISFASAFAITTYSVISQTQSPDSSLRIEIIEDYPDEDSTVDYTNRDSLILQYEVRQELNKFQNDYPRIMFTLHWRGLVEKVVQDPRLKIPKSEQPSWVRNLLGIIFVESGGNPFATSNLKIDPAKGLTQVRGQTADEIAHQYQIRKYDLYNSWDNVFLGLAHQLNLSYRYGKELGIWAHHLGSGNMDAALRVYLISQLKLPIDEVDNQILVKFIKTYDIRVEKLLSSPAVTATLKSRQAFTDSTERYFYRVLAAQKAMGTTG